MGVLNSIKEGPILMVSMRDKPAACQTDNTANEAKHSITTLPLSDESHMIVIHPCLLQSV